MIRKYALIKAIETLVASPRQDFSVRSLAQKANISVGASKSSLDYMNETGIVSLKKIGRTYQYRANLENFMCRQWKILFNLDAVQRSGLVKRLTDGEKPYCILLYGSFAHGTNDEKSDVDVLIIVQRSKPTTLPRLHFPKLSRELNLTVRTISEWKHDVENNKVFYDNVIYDSIVLYGTRPVIL